MVLDIRKTTSLARRIAIYIGTTLLAIILLAIIIAGVLTWISGVGDR